MRENAAWSICLLRTRIMQGNLSGWGQGKAILEGIRFINSKMN